MDFRTAGKPQSGAAGWRRPERVVPSQLRWPAIVVIAALAAAGLVYFDVAGPARAAIVPGFLLVGPGLAFIPLLRLKHGSDTVILAVTLSLALDLIVAAVALYSGFWSPPLILGILIGLSLSGALCQGLLWYVARPKDRPFALYEPAVVARDGHHNHRGNTPFSG